MTEPKTNDPRWTLTLTDATGQTTTLDSRAPLSGSLTVTLDPREVEAMKRRWQPLGAVDLLKTPGPTSTAPEPYYAWSQTPSEQKMLRADVKRIMRGLRNLRNREREREGRIRQEARAELHDLTRPERPARIRLPEPAQGAPPTVDFRGGVVRLSNDLARPGEGAA